MNTLFFFEPFHTRSAYQRLLDLEVSEVFFNCADIQLRRYFEQNTGLKINKNISVTTPWDTESFGLEVQTISSFHVFIYINHNWNPVKIKWQSKSGRIYKLADEDIDCADIFFWFEGLDPILFHKQLYPKEPLPFKFKNLGFELNIERLVVDLLMNIFFDNFFKCTANEVITTIENEVVSWNKKTEEEDAKRKEDGEEWYTSKGVVHNWNIVENSENKLSIQFDMGSASILLVKKIIQIINKRHGEFITRVVVS